MVAKRRVIRKPSLEDTSDPRLPPGQMRAKRWTVLHQGPIPPFDPATWRFQVRGLVRRPLRLTWDQLLALPQQQTDGDLHCVTRWSKLENVWQGFLARDLANLVEPLPDARFVLLHGDGGYMANLPLAAFLTPGVILATHHGGALLTPEHGAPLRAVVPDRYAWKSVKWLRAIEFVSDDQPGFWETYGFSNNAGVWSEERFEPANET